MSKFLFIGDHAETLSTGRRVAPGEELPDSAIDLTHDKYLVDEGRIIELRSTPAAGKAKSSKENNT